MTVTTTNLTSYWNFDEASGDLIDQHGSNDGTLSGADQSETGIINDSYYFNGIADYVTVSNTVDVVTTGSWSFWINVTTDQAAGIITKRDAYPIINSWEMYLEGNGKFWAIFWDLGNVVHATDTSFITTGSWIHIVVTVDGTNVKIYKNGSQYGSDSADGGGDIGNDEIPIFFGDDAWGTNFDGYIDEVGIWSGEALTLSDVEDLYNGGAGLAYPFTGNAGTNMTVNVDDAHKEVSDIYVNVDDSWKVVANAYINKDDSWKTIF